MANPYQITVSAAPSTYASAFDILAAMQANSGVVTDYNSGSQIRTLSEALGSIVELQGGIDQAMAYQALIYSAMSIFGITPLPAVSASGTVIFVTGTGNNPPPAPYNITIPVGTIVTTTAGAQYQTTSLVTINAGQTSVSTTVSAVVPGVNGNTGPNTITNVASQLSYLVFVNNTTAITGGSNAELPEQTIGRFVAKINSLGLATPVSIANAVIGITAPNSTEMVEYSTVYEPWVTGSVSGQYGFMVYIDNGSGTASAALISQVESVLNGSQSANQPGYRPAGVPYNVLPVVPTYVNVVVTGVINASSQILTLESQTTTSINSLFQSLQFGEVLTQVELIASVSNVVGNYVTSLYAELLDINNNPIAQATPSNVGRVILNNLSVTYTSPVL